MNLRSNYSWIGTVVCNCAIYCGLAVTFITANALAADIEWVGDQIDDVNHSKGSFNHGANWLNFIPPGANDTAIFGSGNDPQGNGTLPHDIHFGTFYYRPSSVLVPDTVIEAADTVLDRLEVRTGSYTFDFAPSLAGYSGPPVVTDVGSLTVDHEIWIGTPFRPGNPSTAPASLTIVNGKLTQAVQQTFHGFDIGRGVNTEGRLVIDGTNAEVESASGLTVGEFGGTGYLEVRNGARLVAPSIGTGGGVGPSGEPSTGHIKINGNGTFVGGLNIVNRGSLEISDGAKVDSLNSYVYLGINNGYVGSAAISGNGSSWTNIDRFSIGGVYHTDTTGHGILTISEGGIVSSVLSVIGDRESAKGEVTVTGSGSQWNNSNGIDVGLGGTGTLNIEDGGAVTSAYAWIGRSSGSFGTATVTGSGSLWTNTLNSLVVGRDGTGTLHVADGGVVTDPYGYIGYANDSIGTATVTGMGSLWNNTETHLIVGLNGTGELHIADGGIVASVWGSVGYNSDSTGAVTITDVNSLWKNSTNLYIGGNGGRAGGTASLVVSDGGKVTVGQRFGVWNTGFVDVSGGGSIEVGLSDFEAAGTIAIGEGGELFGTGGIHGNIWNGAGTVSPGASPGVLTINGDYYQGQQGLLLLEIAGTDAGLLYDQLVVTGDATLLGTLNITFSNGFVPQPGDQFSLFVVDGTFDISAATLLFAGAPSGVSFESAFDGGAFVVTAVPEPHSLCLALLAAIGLGLSRTRRRHLEDASEA